MIAEGQQLDAGRRVMITIAVMLASILTALDTTIANVALPHIRGSLSATLEQMGWVLTSYIVATAIMTPLAGWLAGAVGRRKVMLISIAGFTLTSALCGVATSLTELVLFRALQGGIRCVPGADVAGGTAGHQSAGASRPGDGHLGDGRADRSDHRPGAGRLADR